MNVYMYSESSHIKYTNVSVPSSNVTNLVHARLPT